MNVRFYKKLLILLLGSILAFASTQKSEAQAILPGFNTYSLARNDDGSSALVSLGFTISYSGTSRSSLFVNNNGNVTFSGTRGLSSFTPSDLTTTNSEILAPFWGDVDTRAAASAVVTYGTGTVAGHTAFGVNWAGVGYYASHADKLNNFQLVIIDRSDIAAGDWDFEFNYSGIKWETGDASGGTDGLGGESARAGFSLGSALGQSFELPGSSFNGYLLDSGNATTSLIHNDLYSDVIGQYLFTVRNGVVTLPPPATWLGNVDNLWSSANWVIDQQGGSGITVPSSYSDVIFSASGATNENTVLDRDFMIKSLTINSANAVTIGGTNTLTILGTVGTTGITVNSGAGLFTINSNLTLGGGSQTITVNNDAGMVINGVVGGVIGLVKSGTGILLLTGSNTYTGTTSVSNGTLQIGNGTTGSIQASSNVSIQYSGTLLLDLPDNTVFSNAIWNDGTVVIPGDHTIALSGTIQNQGTVVVNGDHAITISSKMSGMGGFVQNSTGTTLLTGSNTYTGSVMISQGVLEIGGFGSFQTPRQITIESAGTLRLNTSTNHTIYCPIVNNGQIVSTSQFWNTLAGVISGTGTLVQNGVVAGRTILTGENTYTGMTTVSEGTLQIGNGLGGSLNSSSLIQIGSYGVVNFNMANNAVCTVDIVNNGGITVIGANTNTLAGNISGSGSFYQDASGATTILSGSNTYTGWTTVRSGILKIGDGVNGTIAASSALSVQAGAALYLNSPDSNLLSHNISNNGVVVLDESLFPSYLYTAAISGSGDLIKTGTNTLILSGSNSYGGVTIVAGGTLQVGSANALPTGSALQVLAGASVDISGISQSLGSLTGDAGVLTGSNTVTTVGSDNSNAIFAGVISGAGDVNKIGSGTWNLTGSNTYTGATSINGGTMLVNGSIQSDVSVMSGVLGGSGIIHGNVINHALVSPGNSPGVLTITGNYNQSLLPTGTLLIQIASKTSYDQLVVGGTATLGGTLSVVNMGNYQLRGNPYTILTADAGVSGTFADISSASLLRLNVIYGSNSVLLESIYRFFGDVPGMTPNESAVAAAVDKTLDTEAFYQNKRLMKTVDYLNALPTQDIPAALEKIVPTDYITLADTSFALAQVQASNLERRMEEIRGSLVDYTCDTSAPSTFYTSSARMGNGGARYIGTDGRELTPTPIERTWGFFLNGSGEFVDDKNSTICGDGKFNTGGISTGADYRFNDNVAAGLTMGYANTTTHGRGDGSVGIDGGDISAYATAFKDGFFVNGILGGAANNYSARRDSLEGVTHGNTSGLDFHALLGGGYTYSNSGFSGGPIASLRYCTVNIDGFSESGSLVPLDLSSQSKSSVQTTAGFQVAYEIPVGTVIIKPQAKAQWLHEYSNDSRNVEASFQGGSAFTVNGPALGSDSLLLDLGASVQITPAVGVYGFYSGNIGASNYTSNSVFGGVQLSF